MGAVLLVSFIDSLLSFVPLILVQKNTGSKAGQKRETPKMERRETAAVFFTAFSMESPPLYHFYHYTKNNTP
jgi:hypothetical protein